MDLCRTSHFLSTASKDHLALSPEAEFNYFVNDWMFIAPSAVADTFALLYERYGDYREALHEVGITLE